MESMNILLKQIHFHLNQFFLSLLHGSLVLVFKNYLKLNSLMIIANFQGINGLEDPVLRQGLLQNAQ